MPVTKPLGERLELLYHLSQTFNSSLDLDQVLNRVIDEVIVATRAERGFVMLQEPDGRLVFKVARGMDQKTIDDPRFQVSLSVVNKVAQQGQPILTSDAQTDERFSMHQSIMILGLRSILCVPLIFKEKILGVIYVDNRVQAGIFTQSDLEMLTAIASNAAIAIENARLYQLAVEKGRLERELQMARQVQASLLPLETPQIPGWDFAARWQPAREVSGDYYDYIYRPDGELGVLIADVTDKGMPAALFMALTRSILRASLDRSASPAEGINHANRLICHDSTNGMFVTLFYAQIQADTSTITYVNAGHNPPLLVKKGNPPHIGELTRTGRALGVLEESKYGQRSVHLDPGDLILLYTDGVTDALNAQGEEFGYDRMRLVVQKYSHASATGLVNALEQAVQEFTGTIAPFDDITLLAIKRLG